MEASKIFESYRALGFVSNHVPLIVRYIKVRKEHLLTTVVDNCFHTYGSDHLKLLSVSNPHLGDITCVAGNSQYVFTACANNVYAWRRGTELKHKYLGHESQVHLIMPFAEHIITVDDSNDIRVFDIESEETILELKLDLKTFRVTSLLHPATYLNKILLGSDQGAFQLWNIRTLTMLYTFKGWKSAVLVLEQAPAMDVVAVGLASGEIYLHNLKFDETVVKFVQEWGPVIGISFRTDETSPQMATASPVGHVAIWDLEKKKLHSQIRHAHRGAVTGLKFLTNEPCLVTSSPDNSLKIWIFDQSDGSGRLLKQREGHSASPTKIRFHGASGNNILSAGLDSTLRSFSTKGDNLNKNLGQASYNRKITKKKGLLNDPLKLPPITDFTSETTREKEWDGIAACHRSQNMVTTWSFDKCRMGEHKLLSQNGSNERNVALCITLSPCGNFVIIGYSMGDAERYNIQSGFFRGKYGKDKAHNGAVRGVAVDGLSQLTLTGGSDKRLAFWNFKSCDLIETVTMDSPICCILLHRESGMIAVALDSQSITIVDQETRKIVRIFSEHYSRINDMTFSPDSRWLITATMDKLIRTWDLPTGRLVDCFVVPNACTSLTMSPIGDFLATTHVDGMGIYLWCNTTLYSHVSLNPLPSDYIPKTTTLPIVVMDGGTTEKTGDCLLDTEDSCHEDIFESPQQIAEYLVTLSQHPPSQWRNLLNLDVIKQRNKPRKPVETPKNAPFFLPTVSGTAPKFDILKEDKVSISKENLSKFNNISAFGQLLIQCGEEHNFSPVLIKLKEMGSSMIDVELRTLSPECGGTEELMELFLRAINCGLKSNLDFELIQAYLGLFLKLHINVISSSQPLRKALKETQECQSQSHIKFQSQINQSLCLVTYFRSAVI